jgi:hypothetical protein
VTIEDHLKERKGIKQEERKRLKEGFKLYIKLSPLLGSIKQSYFQLGTRDGFFERGHFSLV